MQKILGKGRGQNTIDPEEAAKEAEKTKAVTNNNLEQNGDANDDEDDIIDRSDADALNDIQVNDIDPLQTTLRVQTVFPETRKVGKDKVTTQLEVATIRSPYSFAIEEGMSTRFITVTR